MLGEFEFQIDTLFLEQNTHAMFGTHLYHIFAVVVVAAACLKFKFQCVFCILSGRGGGVWSGPPLRSYCLGFSPDSSTFWLHNLIRLLETQPRFPSLSQ